MLALLLLLILLIGLLPLTIFLLRTIFTGGQQQTETLDGHLLEKEERNTAHQWWETQRGRFNINLLLAGAVYITILMTLDLVNFGTLTWRTIDRWNLFNLIMILSSYIIYMGVANLFYSLGAITESINPPKNLERFRNKRFNLIRYIFMLLPVIYPIYKLLN